jgi:hypothetical protein
MPKRAKEAVRLSARDAARNAFGGSKDIKP